MGRDTTLAYRAARTIPGSAWQCDVLRRTDALAFDRTAMLGANKKFSLRDLVRQMREHDVAAMADLFALATTCGAWPSGVDKPPAL
jgi:hypothetical protein